MQYNVALRYSITGEKNGVSNVFRTKALKKSLKGSVSNQYWIFLSHLIFYLLLRAFQSLAL